MIYFDPLVAGATLIMAAGLIYLGYKQLKPLKDSAELSEKSSRAELLIRLNTIYGDIVEARRSAWELHQECKNKYPTDIAQCYRDIGIELSKLRTSKNPQDTEKYYSYRKLMDFGELLGFLVLDRKLLQVSDINGLWGTALKEWAKWFNPHIEDLQKEYSDGYVLLQKLAEKL
ncbi:hypothetical protein ACFLU1_02225 [Chloroflexota bacterium]